MPAPRFVHLRLHSEYSITDGIVRLDAAIGRAMADAMPALALTDLGNLFGMVKFYTAARAEGIKPIVGCDIWVCDESEPEPLRDDAMRMLLLARNHAGYLRLCELLTGAYLATRRKGRAEISTVALREGDNSGLIALSGAGNGDVGLLLLAGKQEQALARAQMWSSLFPHSYYLEVQRPAGKDQAQQEALINATAHVAAQAGLPLVATHPVQFLDAEDFKAHEARVCIAEGYVLADKRRPQSFSEQQYFKSQAEMAELFADMPEALENSIEIARRCNLSIELGRNQLPLFPTPQGVTLDDFMAAEAAAGLEKRLMQLFPDAGVRESRRAEYADRLAFEIKTIVQMGFSGYFLIVADFINWAKNNGVPVGPGRGSGAGSLVAYSLAITDLDPLAYNLLFERFLNPDRVSMPDFDIDFCQEGRDRVIDYVKQKYGAHAVSQIATFGTMAAKAVIRDVGRVLDLPFNFVDQFAKLIPTEIGMSLGKAREQESAINERLEREEELRELWVLAEKLEGVARNVGMHAGGVLIAPGKLSDFCPLYAADGGSVVSQFDKDDVEKVGLVKFDFLGLRTLTILDEAAKFVRKLNPGMEQFRLEDIPLDDKAAYTLFAAANTSAIFQFESRGMRDLLKRARPDRFGDIIALVALYRPGPMDLIPDYCERKQGKSFAYPDPRVESILAETHGIMVYQEQVMQMAQIIGGYSLGGADLLRRAMGKKKAEEMAKHRDIFREGAAKNGLAAAKADEIFDLMEKFAGYGFNKSHAAAYALIAVQTAWLKHYHPAAFMAATLSSEMADTDKVQMFYKDGLDNGLSFQAPDINSGGIRFEPVDATTIRYGLGAIKGTGESALSVILGARREGGAFRSLFDFCERIDKRVVNRRVIEALIRAGAFDSIDPHRAKLLASVGIALEAAEQAERNALQSGLFDIGGKEENAEIHYLDVPMWNERERLLNEKQAIGFFLSGHPFHAYKAELSTFIKRSLAQLEPQKDPVLMAGIVLSTRIQMTRRGKMAVVMLDDGSTQLEVTVFNELWNAERAKLKEDELLLVEGKVQNDAFSGGLRVTAERLLTLAEARGRFAKSLRLAMNGGSNAERLRGLLAPYRNGSCPVRLCYSNGSAETELSLPDNWRVRLDDALIVSLKEWLSPDNVKVIYS